MSFRGFDRSRQMSGQVKKGSTSKSVLSDDLVRDSPILTCGAVIRIPKYRFCPHCGLVIEQNLYKKIQICYRCSEIFCFSCMMQGPKSLECENYFCKLAAAQRVKPSGNYKKPKTAFEVFHAPSVECRRTNCTFPKYRFCPNCKEPCENHTGGKIQRCLKCSTKFCFNCLKKHADQDCRYFYCKTKRRQKVKGVNYRRRNMKKFKPRPLKSRNSSSSRRKSGREIKHEIPKVKIRMTPRHTMIGTLSHDHGDAYISGLQGKKNMTSKKFFTTKNRHQDIFMKKKKKKMKTKRNKNKIVNSKKIYHQHPRCSSRRIKMQRRHSISTSPMVKKVLHKQKAKTKARFGRNNFRRMSTPLNSMMNKKVISKPKRRNTCFGSDVLNVSDRSSFSAYY